MYYIVGKWTYPRWGIDEQVDQKIIYIPNKDIKFCVDDRCIRNLVNKEEMSLFYLMKRYREDGQSCIRGNTPRGKLPIYICNKNINKDLLNIIIEAKSKKDRESFFDSGNFDKIS